MKKSKVRKVICSETNKVLFSSRMQNMENICCQKDHFYFIAEDFIKQLLAITLIFSYCWSWEGNTDLSFKIRLIKDIQFSICDRFVDKLLPNMHPGLKLCICREVEK